MGVLVAGAVKVEEGIDRMKRNLRTMTRETKARADTQIGPAWRDVKNSLWGKGAHLIPVLRKIKPFPKQLEHDTKVFVDRAEVRARMALTGMIERTITELEEVKRRLDRGSPRGWYAA